MAPVKRGFSQKILRPNPALVGRVVEVLRFAAHCPHEKPCVLSGNTGSIVQYKPANRQDEADLRRNRRIELMKPVPVERLRFKCSCGAGDARADKASKTLPVAGKPAPCQETPRFQARVV